MNNNRGNHHALLKLCVVRSPPLCQMLASSLQHLCQAHARTLPEQKLLALTHKFAHNLNGEIGTKCLHA